MRGATVGQLLSELRAECGYSQNQAHGINNRETLVQVMRRTQRRLWQDFDWLHLRVSRDIHLTAGTRFYQCPLDLTYERFYDNGVEVKFGGQWLPMIHGITEREYSIYDPLQNERSWPVRKWDITEDPLATAGAIDDRDIMEVWPMPSDDGVLDATHEGWIRLTGTRSLNAFQDDPDRADLDSDLIVLYAAAEIIGRDRKEDAQMKLSMAQQLYLKLKGSQDKKRSFVLGGEGDQPGSDQQPQIFAHPVPFSRGP